MNRRVGVGLTALLVLTACTNSKASPPPTTRPPLRPVGTSTTVTDALGGPSSTATQFVAVPFGSGCSDTSIPFQVKGFVRSWATSGALWFGSEPGSTDRGIIEVHRGAGLPEPENPSQMTVLGRPATIGTISDGFVLRFTTGSTAGLCDQWALVAHPQTTIDTLRTFGELLTSFAVGERTLECAAGSTQAHSSAVGDQTIMNLVDLPVDRALQTSRQTTDAGLSVLFAKFGLTVHPPVAFDLVVGRYSRGRVGIGWGDHAQPVSVVHVPACEAAANAARVLVYDGGVFALQPECATIQVVEVDQISDVQLGIGTPCPNQGPVEGPTDT